MTAPRNVTDRRSKSTAATSRRSRICGASSSCFTLAPAPSHSIWATNEIHSQLFLNLTIAPNIPNITSYD